MDISATLRQAELVKPVNRMRAKQAQIYTQKEREADLDRLCRKLNIKVGDAELNSTSGAFKCYVQNANNAFIEYKKDSDVRRMLLKRKWLQPGKTERQVNLEKELLSIKASLETSE